MNGREASDDVHDCSGVGSQVCEIPSLAQSKARAKAVCWLTWLEDGGGTR
jgi:hypothetical protein